VLGYQNLDRKKQQFIVDEIKQKQKTPDKFKLKICLVGDSEIELLYKFAKNSLTKPEEKNEESIKENRLAYVKKWKEETKMLKIYSSYKAGYGKSTKILKHARENGCINQHYISLSGNMFVPVEGNSSEIGCEKFLWDQFKAAS
jgi:hypothetical protein